MPTETTALTEEEEDFLALSEARSIIREKILHTLRIYPKLSHSMLQVGIGTSLSPKMWDPILNTLISEGIIVKDEVRARSHIGRDQAYSILRLSTTPQ